MRLFNRKSSANLEENIFLRRKRRIPYIRSFLGVSIYVGVCLYFEKNSLPFQKSIKKLYANGLFFLSSFKDIFEKNKSQQGSRNRLLMYYIANHLFDDESFLKELEQIETGEPFEQPFLLKKYLAVQDATYSPSQSLVDFAVRKVEEASKGKDALVVPFFELLLRSRESEHFFSLLAEKLRARKFELAQFNDRAFFGLLLRLFWDKSKRGKVVEIMHQLVDDRLFAQTLTVAGILDELGNAPQERSLAQKIRKSEAFKELLLISEAQRMKYGKAIN